MLLAEVEAEMVNGPLDGALFQLVCLPQGDGGPAPLVSFYANPQDVGYAELPPEGGVEILEIRYHRQARPSANGRWHYRYIR